MELFIEQLAYYSTNGNDISRLDGGFVLQKKAYVDTTGMASLD